MNYDEAKVPVYSLPALLPDGITGEAARTRWETSRRAEILALFEQHVHGKTPDDPVTISAELLEESGDALNGLAVRRGFAETMQRSPTVPTEIRVVSLTTYRAGRRKRRT